MTARRLADQLYATYRPAVHARCRRLLKDGTAAEDATQEVFVKVLRHLDSVPGEEAVLPWLRRITTNHCLNTLRDERHGASLAPEAPRPLAEDPEEAVVAKDFAEQLWKRTPAALRRAAELYHRHGLEQVKVAEVLGVSRRTVLYRLADFTRRVMDFHTLAEAGEA